MTNRTTKSPPMKKVETDDWDTDPDYIRNMDEMDQRWGSRRTVGSINMSKLIDEVHQDHQKIREKFAHPSQRNYSENISSKVSSQKEHLEKTAHDYNYKEESSEHRSQETSSSKIIKTSTNSSTKVNPTFPEKMQQGNIKSLSEKFESMYREDQDDFRRKAEARRQKFLDEVKSARKNLEVFGDPVEEIEEMRRKFQERLSRPFSPDESARTRKGASPPPAPNARGSSLLSGNRFGDVGSQSSLSSPKVYTKRETHREEIVSKIVKKNDKIVENETKRNVEKTSSEHGSSDDDEQSKQVKANKSSPSPKRESQPMRASERTTISPVGRQSPKRLDTLGSGLMARTLYDYQAAEADELSFDVDELITNIDKIDSGWYKGSIVQGGTKKTGLFPANYVKLLNDNGEY